MTTDPTDPTQPAAGTPSRKGRLTKSRAIAAGASVGALVLVTAGIAAANPAKNDSNGSKASSADANRQNAGATNRGDDSGWFGGESDEDGDGRVGDPGDRGFSRGDDGWGEGSDDGGFQQAPSSGFQQAPSGGFQQAPSGSFDPGVGGGGGHSSSGGS